MRLVLPPVGAPMPSLSWPQTSASLISAEPLSGPASSLPCYKGCSLYEDGWSQRDNVPDLLISARPHSLMASREQCGGIEMLVDELCAKLKQIQDGDTEAPQSPRPNVALVLQDMHSHFGGSESLGGTTEFADSWSNNCYYTDSWQQVNNKHSLPQQKRAATNIWQQEEPDSLIDGGDNIKDAELLRVLAENQQNTLNDYDDENDLDIFLEPTSVNDDDNLACLIAKFDSTVEALWSPPESMILEDKSPLQIESQAFISSGTNLTSSIWSDTSINDGNKEQLFPSLLVEAEKVVGDRGKWSEEAGDTKKVIEDAWNNIENTNTATEEKSWQIGYGLGPLSQQLLDGENESQQNSLNLINHHREKSGFTEVRKSINKTSWSISTDSVKNSIPVFDETLSTEISQEEEDLLTSNKTHFRPIRQSVSHDSVCFEDGTTFAICSGLDEPPYQRSASGCLYLNGLSGSPRKYMLYTEKEPFNGKYITDDGEGGFVPKFAVLKTEKAIQTELDNEDSDIEEDKGVYFPEEEAGQFADNIDCPADIEDEGDSEQESEDSVSEASDGSEPKFGLNFRGGGQPANVPTWSDAKWCGGAVSKAKSSWFHRLWREGSTEASKPSARLREELSAEGEQLIADIQFLQQVFWGDCWFGSQDELAQGLISPPADNCFPPIDNWCRSERTYDEHNAAPRTMIPRSTGVGPLSAWEYPGPPPSSE